ncbi:MAG TPA: hypothetical protein VGK17_16845 [Propionicimonas sp.]|jgi:uncharacterized protein YdhG (YjbR/CyaY superfamily)
MATKSAGLSAEEKAAIKQAAAERKREQEGKAGEAELLAAIDAMTPQDKPIAEGLHALVRRDFPELTCKTWYGYPAYVKDGKTVFFYQLAAKFKTRYGHIGFQDVANLDDGDIWPTAFAILTWTPTVESQVAALIRRAVS